MSQTNASRADIRLGATLYAYTNEFHRRQFTLEGLIAEVARLGQGPGLEIVGFQSLKGFPDVSDDTAARFKDCVAQHQLELTCLGINADAHLRADRSRTREELVDFHARQIRSAAKLGFPLVRYQYAAGPEVIRELAPLARDLNVKLGLEVHAPHTVDHPEVLAYREMYAQVNSPYLGFIPDFGASAKAVPQRYLRYYRGNGIPEFAIEAALDLWAEDSDPFTKRPRYLEWAEKAGVDRGRALEIHTIFGLFSRQPLRNWLEIMPQVIHVHGKFYEVDETGTDQAIDYASILDVFVEGGYRGYISAEWEGHQVTDDPGFPEVERFQKMLKRLLAERQ
ncbi:TIM barrel protein [Rhizobium sp. RU36D]|uniref:sugar phosphate isomerase/epimerase family protein n=1 Tax=Rhizobium sp. RU36D TaxID=1907415 RepID=UPI0009D849EB|nr:TIM barrel protein [Rhizobium sp. RU36D]SMD20106.1 Xylose isomerase-like TIM barrel [Rhizobium sp. RU36D]